MGKLIQFPLARRRRKASTTTFSAFGDLQLSERAQLKLLAACLASATVLTAALQLAVR